MTTLLIETGDDYSKLWEYDFLRYELFSELDDTIDVTTGQIETRELPTTKDVILVFSTQLHKMESIRELAKKIKPKGLFLLSDEYGNKNSYNQLGNYTDVLFRNYHHEGYFYTGNTVHVPLGYSTGFMDEPTEYDMSDRTIDWSFVGTLKSDRYTMLESFDTLPNELVRTTYTKPSEMRRIYENSKFVLSGRGNFTMDCFRLYEASSTGAIPVLVSSQNEFDTTFKYETDPGWLRADSWTEAREMVESLLYEDLNKDQLNDIQTKVKDYWHNRLNCVKERIKLIL